MSFKIPGMENILKQAQQMQENMKRKEAEIDQLEVTGEAGAGLIKITMDGRFNCKKVQIDPSVLKEEPEIVEDLVMAAINATTRQIETIKQEKMADVTGGMNLPDFGGLGNFLK
jgi:DNA-binding YbaB/EbfC family protein